MLYVATGEDLHDIVDALSAALDAKNSYTCGHSERVAEVSLLLAKRLGLSAIEQERIHIGAHLHDIGKIGIPDAILNKPGSLTESEFNIIKQHPDIGSNIIRKVRIFQSVGDIVRHHHERYDGKGYPDGLKGEAISIGARIVAVADAFDAMTTMRPYRLARKLSATVIEMQECRGSQFDPRIIDEMVCLVKNNELGTDLSLLKKNRRVEMEKIIVIAIGAAALGYVAYTVWRGIKGKSNCGCGSACKCNSTGKSGSCCDTSRLSPK